MTERLVKVKTEIFILQESGDFFYAGVLSGAENNYLERPGIFS
jgi:hypothetical protein